MMLSAAGGDTHTQNLVGGGSWGSLGTSRGVSVIPPVPWDPLGVTSSSPPLPLDAQRLLSPQSGVGVVRHQGPPPEPHRFLSP